MPDDFDIARALYAAVPAPELIFVGVAFIVATALLVGMAVAGRGH